jgi:large subunit ribosomal protein L19
MAEETQKEENIEQAAEVIAETPVEAEVVTEAEVVAETPAEPVEEVTAIEEPVIEEPGIIEASLKNNLPEIRQGDMVKVYQKIKEVKDNKTKERTQIFDGQVLAIKHGRGVSATITVRKVISGIGVEKIFPIHSPSVEKIEITKQTKTRRAKLYYLRTAKGRKAKLKTANHAKKVVAKAEEVEVSGE